MEGNHWKQKEAFEQIINHYKFVNSFPIELNMFKAYEEELNRGFVYVYKRDRSFRPIFVLNVAKLKASKITKDQALNLSTYFVQFLITRVLIPGRVENWITIVDMKGIGITDLPNELITAITAPL